MLRKSGVLAGSGRICAETEDAAAPGSVYVFVPAHGESNVGPVQQTLSRAWAEGLGLSVLLADFECCTGRSEGSGAEEVRREGGLDVYNAASAPQDQVARWMERASRRYDVVTADLTPASEGIELEVMHLATSIFIVSDTDKDSLRQARDRAARIRSHGMEEVCALLLRAAPGGMRPDLAEDFTGIPVCSLIDNTLQIKRLAAWLTLDR